MMDIKTAYILFDIRKFGYSIVQIFNSFIFKSGQKYELFLFEMRSVFFPKIIRKNEGFVIGKDGRFRKELHFTIHRIFIKKPSMKLHARFSKIRSLLFEVIIITLVEKQEHQQF